MLRPLSSTLGIAGRKFRGGLPCTVRLRHAVAAKAVCVFAAMRLRHARGKFGAFIRLGCAAHDASRGFSGYLRFGALFSFFVRANWNCSALLGLTWRSTGARL